MDEYLKGIMAKIPQVGETMPGTDAGSTYSVIAKRNSDGLRVGFKPYTIVAVIDQQPWFVFGLRLRVDMADGSPLKVIPKEFFGLPFEAKSQKHASLNMGVPVCKLPCFPPYIRKLFEDAGGAMFIAKSLTEKLHEALPLCMSADAVATILTEKYQDNIPDFHQVDEIELKLKYL